MTAIKKLFTPPSTEDIARKELAEAERRLLEAESAKEYATQMVAYHSTRVSRLRRFLTSYQPVTSL